MTPPLVEAKSILPEAVQKIGDTAIDLSSPKPVGFNGGTTEKGIIKGATLPVFSTLGELVVTSLPTSNVGGKVNNEIYLGTQTCDKTCGNSCGGTCAADTCRGSCGCGGASASCANMCYPTNPCK